MKYWNWLFNITLFFACFYGVARLCHLVTDGFIVANIRSDQPAVSTQEFSQELSAILAQEFHYMGKGAQTYVFASRDGKYVLKCFKFHHQKHRKREALLASYQLAHEKLKDESALVSVHVKTTQGNPLTLFLVDNLNITHPLNAHDLAFVVQKRAKPVISELKMLLEQKNLEGAKAALASLVNLCRKTQEKGVVNTDANLAKNFGFLDGKAVLIDCGNLSQGKNPPPLKTGSLQQWLQDESDELTAYLQKLNL